MLSPRAEQREALKSWAALTGGLIIAALLIVLIALLLFRRHARAVIPPAARSRRKTKTRIDPWAESGKRLPTPSDGSRDETVDIHPDELGPDDVDGRGGQHPWDGPDNPPETPPDTPPDRPGPDRPPSRGGER